MLRAISRGGARPLHPRIHASPSLNQFGAARSHHYHKHIALIHLPLTHTHTQSIRDAEGACRHIHWRDPIILTYPISSITGMFLTESPGVRGTNYHNNCISHLFFCLLWYMFPALGYMYPTLIKVNKQKWIKKPYKFWFLDNGYWKLTWCALKVCIIMPFLASHYFICT